LGTGEKQDKVRGSMNMRHFLSRSKPQLLGYHFLNPNVVTKMIETKKNSGFVSLWIGYFSKQLPNLSEAGGLLSL
jgi:hypothetical protein